MGIITISGQLGSGGDEIAARLATLLQWTLVDHALLAELAKRQGFSPSAIEAPNETEVEEERHNRRNRVDANLLPTLMTELTAEKDCVVLACGSQCIFRGLPGVLHVRIVGGAKERAKRLMDERDIEERSAVRLIEESDEAGQRFIQHHYGEDIDAVIHYDLTINTDRLSVDTSAYLIQRAVEIADLTGKERENGRRLETAHRLPFAHPSEEEFAKVLDYYQIRWEYEPKTFPLAWDEAGNATEAFSPDFYLVDFDLFIELTTLKQSLVTEKNRKIRRFRELYPEVTLKVFYGRDYRNLLAKYGLAKKISSK